MALVVGTNSYVSVADATTYLAYSVNAQGWPVLATAIKEASLISATRMLDRQDWVGAKTSGAQALDWPRTGVIDPAGAAISSVTVPQFIIDATCELGWLLSQDPSILSSTDSGANIEVLQAGSAKIKFFKPTDGGRFPTIVGELVGFYLSSTQSFSEPYFGTIYESDLVDSDLNRGIV